MELIAAYPCLGKTTLGNKHRDIYFEREFNETRSILGMDQKQTDHFFRLCADIICLQLETDYYKIMFITEDDRLLKILAERKIKPILIFPDTSNRDYMEQYKQNVLNRSGLAWWNRVIAPEFPHLSERIETYKRHGYDIRLTDFEKPFVENIIDI